MKGYTKEDVSLHRDGFGPGQPAINVKVHHYPNTEQVVDRFGCSEATAERALEYAYMSAQEQFWGQAPAGDCRVYGRKSQRDEDVERNCPQAGRRSRSPFGACVVLKEAPFGTVPRISSSTGGLPAHEQLARKWGLARLTAAAGRPGRRVVPVPIFETFPGGRPVHEELLRKQAPTGTE